MNCLIVGGDGFIGSHLAQALREAGHRVALGVRRHSNGVDRIACDLARDGSRDWLPRLRGIELVINTVGIFQERRPGDFARLHDRGPRRLFIACRRAGVGVIQLSALGAEADAPMSPFLASKRRADAFLLRLGIPRAVLLPGLVVGEGGRSTGFFAGLAALPVVPVVQVGEVPLVHIARLGRSVVRLAEHLPPGGERWVVAEWRPLGEYLDRLRGWLGRGPAPQVPLPLWPLAALFRWWPRLRLGLLDRESLRMLESKSTAIGVPEAPGDVAGPNRMTPNAVPLDPGNIESDLAAHPPSRAFRLAAATRFLPGLGLAALAVLWGWTALCSLTQWPVSLGLIHAFGVADPQWGPALILCGAALDAGLGLALLHRSTRTAALAGQLLLTTLYSLLVAVALPGYWLHPFAPLAKNLPLMALTLWLLMHYREEERA